MGGAAMLSVADIANDRGWDRTRAWRWLRRVERQYGAKLVIQKRTLYIDTVELARVAALVAAEEKDADSQLTRELRRVADRLDELETRQNGLAKDVSALRKAVGI